jgi:flagellar motor switch protein FliG
MPYDRSDRIRRAAILVASLDEPLAEQLLADLPPSEAARILSEAEALEAIDPDEQRDVLAEFRRLTRGRVAAEATGAVEFTYSSGDDTPAVHAPSSPQPETYAAVPASTGLSDADAAAMAELLAGEHPQIVAAALSRLPEDQSAAVFTALPADIQAQALERLASLAPIDEDAVQEIETQLQQRLDERRQRQARSAAGAALVQRMLARTPETQRNYLLERMSAKDATTPAPASKAASPSAATLTVPNSAGLKLAYADAMDPVAQQAFELASAVRRAQASGAYRTPAPTPADRTDELEALSDEALVAGLRAAGEPTVLRALAASGDGFLKRVTSMLPRKQAKQLRRMLRDLGPTRLADLHEAQHRLLELAYDSMVAEAA